MLLLKMTEQLQSACEGHKLDFGTNCIVIQEWLTLDRSIRSNSNLMLHVGKLTSTDVLSDIFLPCANAHVIFWHFTYIK